jgi:hypothetical protein
MPLYAPPRLNRNGRAGSQHKKIAIPHSVQFLQTVKADKARVQWSKGLLKHGSADSPVLNRREARLEEHDGFRTTLKRCNARHQQD